MMHFCSHLFLFYHHLPAVDYVNTLQRSVKPLTIQVVDGVFVMVVFTIHIYDGCWGSVVSQFYGVKLPFAALWSHKADVVHKDVVGGEAVERQAKQLATRAVEAIGSCRKGNHAVVSVAQLVIHKLVPLSAVVVQFHRHYVHILGEPQVELEGGILSAAIHLK